MRTVSIRLSDLERASIPIGFVGENMHTQMRIDCLKLFEEYPTATPSMTVNPPKGDSYPAVVVRDGNIVVWDVTDSDLIYEGNGEIQLKFTVDEVVAKSYIGRIRISRSLTATGEIPDPVQNWIDNAEDVLEAVEDAIPTGGTTGQVLAKKTNTDYDLEWVDQSGGGTSDYDELTNKPEIGGVELVGNKSLSDLGAASTSDVSAKYTKPGTGIPSSDMASAVQTSLGKADTAYQKPSDGIPASDIASGVIPDPTSIIDDTAGDGATNKVWSADKVNELKSQINAMDTATASDVDKCLSPKTVSNGKVTEWQFIEGGGGSIDPSAIAEAVDDWCDENITNPSNPPLDRSLSLSSAAAPADIVGEFTEVHISKNLYDKVSCSPSDGYMYNKSGVYTESSAFATTGKIPVDASTQYIFSAGSATVVNIRYFSGNDGSTFISAENLSGAFTTPSGCTYIAINMFGASHTTEQYNAAIAAAQLEKGSTVTPYEPFGVTHYVPVDAVGEGGTLGNMFTEIHGKNLYDKSACNPQDGKYYNNSGELTTGTYYAVSGVVPCDEKCTYICTAGTTFIQYACYFNDDLFISRETINGGYFTTPANCNGVGFNLFSKPHTTEEYNTAINSLQLEAGTEPTTYEAYQSAYVDGYSFIVQGIGTNVNKTISQNAIANLLNNPKRTTWWNGKKGDSLGDSITYKFDNFQKFVKYYLNLSEFYNNGMTGTKMAGTSDPTWGDSMWMDSRINALHADADFITILGGANDSANEDIGTVSIENYDTDTYCGAFNVIISKIYYRYLALSSGYYGNVDYTGVNQLSTPKNVIIIPCTMFYVPGGIAKLKDKANAIRTLSEAWGLKVCDFYGTVQANPFVANYYWSQSDTVHPNEAFYKERLAPLLINAINTIQPIDYSPMNIVTEV